MAGGWLMQVVGAPWPLALLGALAVGATLGFVNGWTVVRTGLHSFIITLASMSIYFGVMIFLTRVESYRGIPSAISVFSGMRLWGFLSPLARSSASTASSGPAEPNSQNESWASIP